MNEKLVYHPSHYNTEGRKECWEEMEDIFGKSAVVIFDVLSAYKYLYRAGSKEDNPTEQDFAKIDNYINHASNLYNDGISDCAKQVLDTWRNRRDFKNGNDCL